MLDPVIMDREYEAQTAGSMTRSEQNTNPVVAERDHITIIDIVVDVEILPCIRPVREKWIFRPKIVVDFTEIGFAAKAVHQPLAAAAVVKVPVGDNKFSYVGGIPANILDGRDNCFEHLFLGVDGVDHDEPLGGFQYK